MHQESGHDGEQPREGASRSESSISLSEQLAIRETLDRAVQAIRARTTRGVVAAVATATGNTPNTVRAYLLGKRRPTVTFIRDLARYAGLPVSEFFVTLGWLPAEEAMPVDTVQVAESVAALAATLGRLEPHVRHLLDATTMTSPAPFAAAAALLADVDGAERFDVRMFKVVSGGRYRAITNGCAEFALKPGRSPLPRAELDDLARQSGQRWRPSADDTARHPAYWAVDLELRCRTYAALRDTDVGQSTWQGEPGTHTWAEQSTHWPSHLLVQDPFGGVAQPARRESWRSPEPRTLVFIGARYTCALAAAALAEALGWQFVPVRSDMEMMSDGRIVPVARERLSGRVQAWSSVARHIVQRSHVGDPWPAVILVRPAALSGRERVDRYAADLLRNTPASVVYVRPSQSMLDWWTGRQVMTSLADQFDASTFLERTRSELHAIEHALAQRDQTRDLYLAPDEVDMTIHPGAAIPEQMMDAQAQIAWTVLTWLDGTANRSRPSILTRLQPGTLARWIPLLACDPNAKVPRLKF